MILFQITKRRILSATLATLLVCSFILTPVSQTLEVQKVEAAPVTVVGGFGTIQETISAASEAVKIGLLSSLQIKEFALDAIAWGLINIVLQEMVRSVTTWVNSGFEGSPAFLTDMDSFLTDIGDKIAKDFLAADGSALKGLCSPFKINIQIALNLQYEKIRQGRTGGYRAQCTLGDVVNNMDSFFNGDFAAGGWAGWLSMTQTMANNPYGAYIESENALAVRITNAQGNEIKNLEFGRGFLSMKKCKDGKTATSEKICTTVTPGAVIESTLNESLASGQQRLTVADEINELIAALFSQLASKALSGVGGLLGLTDSNASGGGSNYFDQIDAEQNSSGSGATSVSALNSALGTERRHLSLQQQIVSLITNAQNYVEDNNCNLDSLSPSLSSALAEARYEVTAGTALITNIETLIADYALLKNENTTATVISGLLTKYNATSIPGAEAAIITRYLGYQSSGALHSIADITTIEQQTIPDLTAEINSLTSSCRRGGR